MYYLISNIKKTPFILITQVKGGEPVNTKDKALKTLKNLCLIIKKMMQNPIVRKIASILLNSLIRLVFKILWNLFF